MHRPPHLNWHQRVRVRTVPAESTTGSDSGFTASALGAVPGCAAWSRRLPEFTEAFMVLRLSLPLAVFAGCLHGYRQEHGQTKCNKARAHASLQQILPLKSALLSSVPQQIWSEIMLQTAGMHLKYLRPPVAGYFSGESCLLLASDEIVSNPGPGPEVRLRERAEMTEDRRQPRQPPRPGPIACRLARGTWQC